ncbi:MAG: alpha/beta hydrolase [Gammaproteobacteria bacterium]|nr:hypothetical protein [Chlamydiales bacterium]MCH9690370.1 alpha/beta hydrolase [Gammaproteobacteria bacterium]
MHGTLVKSESREWITIANEGIQLFGVVHRPLQVENPPLVVVMHGFASSKHGSNRCYVALAEALTTVGIACLRFDFRGCGDSEGSMNEASVEDLISDGVAVSKFALSIDGVDATRVGIFGASLGGAIAVEVCDRLKGVVKALTLWAPVASGELWFRDFIKKHPEMLSAEPTDTMGTYRGVCVSPLFREQFARLHAYKTWGTLADLPLLHMHGEGDAIISIAHQEAYKQVAQSDAKFITYPEEAHSLGFAKALPDAIEKSVTFFKETL